MLGRLTTFLQRAGFRATKQSPPIDVESRGKDYMRVIVQSRESTVIYESGRAPSPTPEQTTLLPEETNYYTEMAIRHATHSSDHAHAFTELATNYPPDSICAPPIPSKAREGYSLGGGVMHFDSEEQAWVDDMSNRLARGY